MNDVLIYWRDYAANWAYQFAGERAFYWHSSAKCIAELQPGDRMWMVTSGKGLREDAEQACLRGETHRQAAFLVGVWAVREVIDNPNDDVFAPECVGTIPTVSHWGLIALALVLLSAGKIYFRAKRSVIQGS